MMIRAKEIPNRTFETKEDMFRFLKENKNFLISQKKMATKLSDPFAFSFAVNEKGETIKTAGVSPDEINTIRVKAVINSTNIYDSHGDVSINGSWNRTAKNSKNIYLLKEHKMNFENIISDEVEVRVEKFNWKDLGFNYLGETECLVFYATLKKERNPYMFGQYAKGYVKEHSAGLHYIQLELAINSDAEWDKEEKAVWDKYYNDIVNKEDVDEYGYFWAVTEQKIIEGSAVVKGSNFATPTILVEPVTDTSTAKEDSDNSTPKSVIENYLVTL